MVLIFTIIVFSNLFAQITQLKPIHISEGLNNGTIQATVVPPFTINTIEKIFDGNHLSEAAVQNSDSVTITLEFQDPVKIASSKVFFWNDGKWKLEAANTLSDLNSQIGSYQLLAGYRNQFFFIWDSVRINSNEARFIRLTAKNLQNDAVYIGEWILFTGFNIIDIKIQPESPRLVVGTSFPLEIKLVGEDGKLYPYNLNNMIFWRSDNISVITVDEFGTIAGQSLGNASIMASAVSFSDTVVASVLTDFQSVNAPTLNIKVALVLQNPIIDSTNKRRINEVRNWTDPLILVDQILQVFNEVTDGVIRFQIVETHNDEFVFTKLDGEFMSIDTLAYFYGSLSNLYGRDRDGTLQNLAEKQGRVRFDYHALIDHYDFVTRRNNNQIHEVWVYAHPFAGMAESQLVGPNGFWYNSSPIEHPGLNKQIAVMGWNFERGVAEAMESFGHRSESALVHAYGDRWDVFNSDPTPWEIFTRIDKDFPGGAHVGNIHFPPNGMSDYDYSNRRNVKTYADNWKRYPILLDQVRTINCDEWECTHLGYLKWWYSHLPRFTGVSEGILNNWWHYIVDYEGAVAYATQLSAIENNNDSSSNVLYGYKLEQNYPNPFNSLTTIQFSIPLSQHVSIKVYDLLGREIISVIDEWKPAGNYAVNLDGTRLASGLYFYKIKAGKFNQTKKFILIR